MRQKFRGHPICFQATKGKAKANKHSVHSFLSMSGTQAQSINQSVHRAKARANVVMSMLSMFMSRACRPFGLSPETGTSGGLIMPVLIMFVVIMLELFGFAVASCA